MHRLENFDHKESALEIFGICKGNDSASAGAKLRTCVLTPPYRSVINALPASILLLVLAA
jgi:hypothetical protein